MSYEVEQKFPVDDLIAMAARLHALGATPTGDLQQADTYFNHPAHDFAQTDEALRIRQVGSHNFITYKGPKLDRQTKTRREIELPLAAGAQAAADFFELLAALGFRRVTQVRKERRTLRLDWHDHSIEAALDNVAGVGTFVELEATADEAGLDAARAAIQSLAAELGLSQSERRSYLEMLLTKAQEGK